MDSVMRRGQGGVGRENMEGANDEKGNVREVQVQSSP